MLIAQYELLGRVSQTGRGSVWKGWDNILEREVALKQVIAPSDAQREQLRVEASTLAGLHDENIVGVYDLVEESDDAWLVQEWIDGVSLRTIAEHNPDLTSQQVMSIFRGALLGLAHAHQQQFVHGDVSPTNILVDVRGISKLIDFGLAGRWGTQSLGGTPGFASPEALEQQQLAPTADVYSAAVVLTGMLLHKPVFGGSNVIGILAQQRLSPDLSALPAALEQVLLRALALDPGQRQGDASVLLRELDAAAERTYGPGWALVGGVAGLVSATMAAVAITGQATTLGTSAVAGAASPTGSTAAVSTSTAASTSSGVGSQVTGLGSTGASNTGIDFVSNLSNTTGGATAPPPEVEISVLKTAAADSVGSSAVGAGGAAKAASTVAKPLVLVAAVAAVVAIVVAAVFLFGGDNEPESLGAATETVAGSAPVITSGAETAAAKDVSNSATQTSTRTTTSTSTPTTSTSTPTTSSAETTPESAAALPANPALGFNGVYSFTSVLVAATSGTILEVGSTTNAVWKVTSACDEATCTAVVNSSSGRTYTFIEAGGEWKNSGTNVVDCYEGDFDHPIGVQVLESYERTLRATTSADGQIMLLEGEFIATGTEPCDVDSPEFPTTTFTQTLTYLGPDTAITFDPTPVTQTS